MGLVVLVGVSWWPFDAAVAQPVSPALVLPTVREAAEGSAPSQHALRAALQRCADIPADDARLVCFDALLLDAGSPGPTAIQATAVGVRRRPRGEHVFELSNGQVWAETEAGRGRYPAGIEVQIHRTTLGSYMLSTEQGRATRVRRLE